MLGVALAVAAKEEQAPREALLARVEELVDEVLFHANVPGQHVHQERVRERGRCGEMTAHRLELDAQYQRLLDSHGRGYALRLAGQAALVSFRPGEDPAAVSARLYDAGVIVRFIPGTDLVRVSCGWWNSEDDLERLLAAL